MSNQYFKGARGTIYKTKSSIGKGGEGEVLELEGWDDIVVKVYNESLTQDKINKLKLMTTLSEPEIHKYAAWPQDIVTNEQGIVCGFTMKKLTGFVPMHMLFSPVDRKRNFPDKGYNFLVHVAKNLSLIFGLLHTRKIVVGDVNEGNLLVNSNGMLALIDCDSFQLKDGGNYFYCEVGVPRYTAPELYTGSSFTGVVRTTNTDNFALAILIFQLLFLGRHPFAGRNMSSEDISEEDAIKRHLFAYSRRNPSNKLLPPLDAVPMGMLSNELSDYFHRSFEQETDRPSALSWAKAIEDFLKTLKPCTGNRVHFYPANASKCLWCEFKERRNILYFLDDNILQNVHSHSDIDTFVNGIKMNKLVFPAIQKPTFSLSPIPVNDAYRNYNIYQGIAIVTIAVLFLLIGLGLEQGYLFGSFSFVLTVLIYFVLPWRRRLHSEKERRKNELTNAQRALKDAIATYHQPNGIREYEMMVDKVNSFISAFKKLPLLYRDEIQKVEEAMYNKQLSIFLRQFTLEKYDVPGIGDARKLTLAKAGIITAEDVEKLQSISVSGIGPKFTQNLLYWRKQMESKFVYRPDNHLLNNEKGKVNVTVGEKKKMLGNEIKKYYTQLLQHQSLISGQQLQIREYVYKCYRNVAQAEIDIEELRRVLGKK